MNVKKNEKTGYKKGGLWNRLRGARAISFDIHTLSQTNVNGFDDAASQLVDENTKKLEAAASLRLERCRMEADRLRFKMI